jgi:hypothetical protein
MKRAIVVLMGVGAMVILSASALMATPGGKPIAHGLTETEFGAAVSENAQIADHASSGAQGKPAAHGLSGSEFCAAVSAAALINDHVSN